MVLKIFTDGSCIDNKRGLGCGWAYVLVEYGDGTNEEVCAYSGGMQVGTNNIGEMSAVIRGMRRLAKLDPAYSDLSKKQVEVITDSMYVVDGITKYINNWKKNGWETYSGSPVKNKELWKEMDSQKSLLEKLGWEVKIRHIRGHSGHKWNERVDKLANAQGRKNLEAALKLSEGKASV